MTFQLINSYKVVEIKFSANLALVFLNNATKHARVDYEGDDDAATVGTGCFKSKFHPINIRRYYV